LLDISERNGYTTYGHSMRVAEYTDMMLRDRTDISPHEKAKIRLAALIHDVGKIGVANDVWRIPDRPPPAEQKLIDAHSTHSKTIADGLFARIGRVDEAEFKDISTMAKYHQEYYDGTRHNHVKGDDIPIGARIISLADTYDAILSLRSYKEPNPPSVAVDQFKRFSGTQFDPNEASRLIRIIEKK
jgi:HD-GYP domain-containing protein (c-di-GMP phosphodiesterase class II)